MKDIELEVEKICNKYDDAELEYHIEDGTFYYDMDKKYDNEIMITFPQGSNQVFGLMNDLGNTFHEHEDVYWTENYGDESDCEYDRVWVWW